MRRVIALLLTVLLIGALAAVPALAEDGVHTLDTTKDLAAMAAGDKADGDTEVVNDYFTIIYKAKTKIDGSDKEFEDGYTASQRLNFGGKTEPGKGMIASVKFVTEGPATLKIWWVSGGDGREMALYNEAGEVIAATDPAASVKNSLYINELAVPAAGTYYVGVPTGSNYVFKLEVSAAAADVPTPPAAPTTPEEIVNAAYALESGAALEGSYTLTGVITAVNTAYSEQYKNVTVTIQVGDMADKPIMCFRLKGEGADVITVGDTITVTGSIKNYNGTIEYDAGCTLDAYTPGESEDPVLTTPEEIVNAAYALEPGAALPVPYTLTGVILSVDTEYSEQYKNVTVTIQIADMTDKPIVCFRLKGEGADTIKAGDIITVTGSLKNYNGTIEFDSGCTLDAVQTDPIAPPPPTSDPISIVAAAFVLSALGLTGLAARKKD